MSSQQSSNQPTKATTADVKLLGFAVRVMTSGSLWATHALHRILATYDTRWPYVVEPDEPANNVNLLSTFNIDDVQTQTEASGGPGDTWLWYETDLHPEISVKLITDVCEWLGKNLPFDGDTFKLDECTFRPITTTTQADWCTPYEDSQFTAPVSKLLKHRTDIAIQHSFLPAELSLEACAEVETEYYDVSDDTTTADDAAAEEVA